MSYIVPIGPYHPALEEPVHAKLYTEGEVIKDAEVFVGYNHRGIEKLATERNAIQTLVLVERVCGICSHSHAFTYAMAVEGINGVEVPKRGEYIRVITAELERLHSHRSGRASPSTSSATTACSCTPGTCASSSWICWRPSPATA